MSSHPLAEMTVRDLTARLATSDPVPGGGSASALAGALGAALVEMVCELTVGRPEHQDVDPVARQIGDAAADLRRELLEAAEADATAYEAVVMARRLPRTTDEERANRKAAIGVATVAATEVPLRVAELATEVLGLVVGIAPIGNRHAVSDTGVAALLAATAARGAAFNVRINLPSLPAEHPLRTEAPTRLTDLEATVAEREQQAMAIVRERMPA